MTSLPRPRFHHAPTKAWMNDPVGLVRLGDEWHLFYQRAEDEAQRAMGWGHAVSRDLLSWEPRPTAIAPGEQGWIYSGSTVVDRSNRSNLGGDRHPPLLAFYTHHDPATGRQRQELAVSLDGERWRRHEASPLIDEQRGETRDPFVFAYGAGWRMLVAEPVAWTRPEQGRSRLALYASDDLLTWMRAGTLDIEGEPFVMFETPALLPLALGEGEAGTWLLLVGTVDRTGDGARCSTRAWTGRFDGKRFAPDGPWQPFDHGPDFYAAAAFAGLGPGETVVTAWLNSWSYARRLPGADWSGGAHALPRRVTGHRDGAAVAVHQTPAALPSGDARLAHDGPVAASVALGAAPLACRVELTAQLAEGAELRLVLDSGEERLTVALRSDAAAIERRGPRAEALPAFAGRWPMPLAPARERSAILLIDAFAVELFVDGRAATAIALRDDGDTISLAAEGDTACRCTIMTVAP